MRETSSSATAGRADQRQLRDMNEALLVSSLRQHELTELAQQAEAASRESEARYRTLFDLGPVAVYSCEVSGMIRDFNRVAAELWGRQPKPGDTDERFCGSFKWYRPDGTFMPHDRCPMAEVLSGKIPEARDREVLIERPDGTRVTVIVNIRPLKNEREEITGAINCFVDITERKRAEVMLAASEAEYRRLFETIQEQATALADLHRRKDEFLAMLSHELRNPLAPIASAVHLLRLQPNEGPVQQQARTIIERQVAQLTRLVDDLMEVSRITTGRVQLRLERVAVNGIVELAVETARPLIDRHQHELTVSLSPAPIWLYADAARLEQVVVNLLTNAAKYTVKGGRIAVSVELASRERERPEECVVRVRDTGVGIVPELLPRIFDLFTQAERTLDRSQGGLGIGLALVQRLVELHGGRVEVHSSLGQGSEFVVRLPLWKDEGRRRKDEAKASASSFIPPPSSLKVLVVDDNVDAAEILALLLKTEGHDVRTAYTGPTAVAAAIDYNPNVVLLDIGLPGLDGHQVAKRIRQQPANKETVLVALTGYGQESDRQQSQAAGFDHHLVKPADFGKVLEILATLKAT